VTKTMEGEFFMISKDTVRNLKEIEIIENPNATMSHKEKKQLIERIQFLINNDPENEEIKTDRLNPNIMEDIKCGNLSESPFPQIQKLYS
jgi:hypothetical protein